MSRRYATIYAGDGMLTLGALTVITAVPTMTVRGSAAVPPATPIVEREGQAPNVLWRSRQRGKAFTRLPAGCKRIEALLRVAYDLSNHRAFPAYSQLCYNTHGTQVRTHALSRLATSNGECP